MITSNNSEFQADLVTVNKLCSGLGAGSCSPLTAGSARRNLFGARVENCLAEQLREQVVELAERSSKEWNFDFVQESPLPGGRYLWERVPVNDVPQLYSTETSTLKSKKEDRRISDGEKENSLFLEEKTDDDKSKSSKASLFQTSIKGFSKVQKRRSSKRLKTKNTNLVKGSSLVADYILDNIGVS